MSAILGTSVTGAGGGAYTIDNSLRFRASASANLQRTFTSAGNRTTWTFSVWLKKCGQAVGMEIFGSDYGDPYANPYNHFGFQSSPADALNSDCGPEGTRVQANTSAIYRDPSAWYHVVCAFDTTQATAANRIKYYVNGVQQTMTGNFPAQNYQGLVNSAGLHSIGVRLRDNANYFNGYMAEFYFIDGQALTPSSFGATNASTGVWQPKAYSGSYGTNGFYLKFSDIATTSGSNAGLGKDFSGNGNYWTTNNISVTSGVTYDAMTDSPTPKSSTVGNFCTMNPLLNSSYRTDSNGNLTSTGASSADSGLSVGTLGVSSGKWYWEYTVTTRISNDPTIGLTGVIPNLGNSANQSTLTPSVFYRSNGAVYKNTSNTTSVTAVTNGDVIGFALDLDNLQVSIYRNNTLLTTQTGLTAGTYYPAIISYNGSVVNSNFGQKSFTYTPPTGYVALNTYNLPTPTIGATASSQAGKYFNIALYSGNSANPRSISGVGLQPDFVWVKQRSSNGGGFGDHQLYDSVRGTQKLLRSNTTDAELANPSNGGVQSFDSDGFTIQGSSASLNMNATGETYVAWNWRASNTTAVTNTAGSITSTVSANTTSGFSVVTYTGTGANATVGHGLGVAPKMYITKARSTSGYEWMVYHSSLGNTQYIYLSTTGAAGTSSLAWNNTSPTSTVFSLGTGTYGNANGTTYVAYCFAEVAGYSKFGSYTGNSSTDGTFVYTGFRPAYVMIKRSSAAGQWSVRDDMRLGYNPNNYALEANQSTAETSSTAYTCDLLSNGFKLRTADDAVNLSGSTYIYMAFAENPFNYSLAR